MAKSHKIRGGTAKAGTGQPGTGQPATGQPGISQAGGPEAREAKPLVGGVLHDERGNAVWHWASDTARNAKASTSALLRRLNVSSLSLEEQTLDEEERRKAAAWEAYSAAAAAAGRPTAAKAAAKTGLASGTSGSHGPGAAAHKPRARSWWRRLFQRR